MRRLAVFSLILSLAWLCTSMSRPARAGDTVLELEACTSARARRAELQAELDRLDRRIAGCSSDEGAAVSRDGVPSAARASRRKQMIGPQFPYDTVTYLLPDYDTQYECKPGA
jgi:hypothetical protein